MSLQQVKKLNIREEGFFAIEHCPNIEEIFMDGWGNANKIIDAAGKMKHLKRIDLDGDQWNATVSNSTSSRLVEARTQM